MGHLRIPSLPDTAPWRRVVALIAEDADVATIATAASQAAVRGLDQAINDPGIIGSVWLLTQIVLASRENDFPGALGDAGIIVPSYPNVFDLTSGLSEALDRRLERCTTRTDLSEIAQLSAVESVTALCGERSAALFDTDPSHVQAAAKTLSTRNGFSTLAHDFFSRFTGRFLAYHLDRELPHHVGGNGRFTDPLAHAEFLSDLNHHSRQAALIVRDFAGDWYAKNNFLGGITPAKARGFANHTLKKLRSELTVRGGRRG